MDMKYMDIMVCSGKFERNSFAKVLPGNRIMLDN